MTRAELSDMIALARRLLAAGEPGLLSTLIASNGSTYRRLGSMMVSGPPPLIAGGVSGGCLEGYIARAGRSLTQDRPAATLSFDADPDQSDLAKPVLGCGGSIEVLVELLNEEHLQWLETYLAAITADVPRFSRCTVRPTGFEQFIVQREWLKADEGERITAQSKLPDGGRALLQYIPPMNRLVVFGAGDDVIPLGTMARGLGWHVTIADRRARLATRSRFPDADAVLPDDWQTAIEQIRFTDHTAVVLMTHSLEDDIEILPLLQDKPMFYAGALGPAHRRQWLIDGASRAQPLDESFAAGFRGPIGLNLGDRTATGIAVSILAEILAELNHRNPTPLSRTTSSRRPAARALIHHG